MKSVQLLYPQSSLVRHLTRFLRLNQFNLLTINEKTGVIHGIKKRMKQSDLVLNLNVKRVDTAVTDIKLSLSTMDKDSKPVHELSEEEKLLHSIEHSLM